MEALRSVVDHAHRYNVALYCLGFGTAVAGAAASFFSGWALVIARCSAVVLALAMATVGYFKSRNESRFKRQEAEAKAAVDGALETLDEALKAEERRVILLLNGALLDTALKLKDLPIQANKDIALGGFRTAVVNKICELVQSDAPRAAYFRVEDLDADQRVMTASASDVAARNREDTFTARFVEGSGQDEGVWELIDRGDEPVTSNDLDRLHPAGWDASRTRRYKSFVSVPVRVGGTGLGMLTANTQETDGFSQSDLGIMKVLANLLAVAELAAMSSQKQNLLKSKKHPAARQHALSDEIVMLDSGEGVGR